MKKAATKLFIAILVLAVLILISSSAVYFNYLDQNNASQEATQYLNSPFSNSETVYMIIGFSLVLPIMLLTLAVSTLFSAIPLRKYRKKQKKVKKAKKAKNHNTSRFPGLTKIDADLEKYQTPVYRTYPLDELCHRFRNYAAGQLKLYYDITDIRRFVAGLGISKLMILRGMSGTGKTSLAYAAGEFFGNSSTIVPIQPMWKERSDMIGYFNEFTKKFSETTMLRKLYEAGGKGDIYITVLDEVNISRIEYYFAEFLSLLELPDANKRYIDVVSDTWKNDPVKLQSGRLLLPDNMWFIGTANNDDSTFAISDKVYDRAAVIDLEQKCTPFECEAPTPCHISHAELTRLFEEAKQTYTLSGTTRERLAKLDAYLGKVFRISFGNRIMRQIEAYIPIMLACGGNEIDALDDILARKILRKLEQLSPAYVKSEADGLLSLLDELFGEDALIQSRQYIGKLQKGY